MSTEKTIVELTDWRLARRNNGGESLVCNWFDPDIKNIVCQWDGGSDQKTQRGGVGFIMSGAMTHDVDFKPLIEWSCGFHESKIQSQLRCGVFWQ